MSIAEQLDPSHSACGIHTHTGPACERCAAHAVWLAEELANTKPYYEIVRERERMATIFPNDEDYP